MHPVPLVELAEQRRGSSVVMLTITAGTARALLKAAKARWQASGELDTRSLYDALVSRRNAVTIMVDRMRKYGDRAAIPSNAAREVLAEVGADTSRIGPVNREPVPRVFAAR